MQNATAQNREPLAITGMGLVSATGHGVDSFWDACAAQQTHLGVLQHMPTRDLVMDRGGEVPAEFFSEQQDHESDADSRAESMARAAIGEALSMASLDPAVTTTGVALGTALGSAESVEEACRSDGAAVASWRQAPLANLTDSLARRFGLGGPRWTFSVTCVSGLYAIEQAVQELQRDRAGAMVCGGLDTLSLFMQSGFCSLRALSLSGEVRPFDRGHDGIVLGEGAAVIVLERLSDARQRGARVIALLAANQLVSDATHLTSPDATGRGMAEAIAGAVSQAGIGADELACVTPTAVGSPVYDAMQSRAVIDTFGDDGRRIPVTTWEPVVGHALASTGVLGIVHAVLALDRGQVLPTFGLDSLDEACELDYVVDAPRHLQGSSVLALTVGFGGQNGATIVRSADEADVRVEDGIRHDVHLVSSRVAGGLLLSADASAGRDAAWTIDPEQLAEMFPGRWNPRRSLPRGVDTLVAALCGAVEDAGWWTPGQESLVEGGLVVGTDYQSLCVASNFARDLMADGPGGISPGDFLFSLPSSAAAAAGILFGLRDYQATVTVGGLSGFLSIGHAVDRLESGHISRLVVGTLSVVTPEMLPVLEGLGYDLGDDARGLEMAVACCLEAGGASPARGSGVIRLGFEGQEVRDTAAIEAREFGGNTAGFSDNSGLISGLRGASGDLREAAREMPIDAAMSADVELFKDDTEVWLDDLPPGYRRLAAPSLLALLRAGGQNPDGESERRRLVHRDPTETMSVALRIDR